MRYINDVWASQLMMIMEHGTESAPRGKKIKEIIGSHVKFDMTDPIVTVAFRKQNYKFAFGEASWILSGSNRVSDITRFMKSYVNFSDDGFTLNGAYGPKFIEQISWVAKTIAEDIDTRQAVMSFWRERPGASKDIPCTLTQQYLVRDGVMHVVATMRSNDLAWGFCYDTFTFTMMARAVQILLKTKHGIDVFLGSMTLNQGSAHIYEPFWEKAKEWTNDRTIDPAWQVLVQKMKDMQDGDGLSALEIIFGASVAEGVTVERLVDALQRSAFVA